MTGSYRCSGLARSIPDIHGHTWTYRLYRNDRNATGLTGSSRIIRYDRYLRSLWC